MHSVTKEVELIALLPLATPTNSQNSQILNEARLKVLQARQGYVNRVLDEALEHLVKAAQDEEMYKKVLQKLIEQVKSPAIGGEWLLSLLMNLKRPNSLEFDLISSLRLICFLNRTSGPLPTGRKGHSDQV